MASFPPPTVRRRRPCSAIIYCIQQAPPTVTNVVDFGERVGQLRVTALASTPSRPMEGFVPRRGDGRFLGLNILGVSQTEPPKVPIFFFTQPSASGHRVCVSR